MFGPWGETMARWQQEGLNGHDWRAPFSFDAGFEVLPINLGFAPNFAWEILCEEGDYQTVRGENGITVKQLKDTSGIPMYLDYPVKIYDDWANLRDTRLNPNSPERFPANLAEIIQGMKQRDAAVQIGSYPYGLFGTLRDLMGVEELLISFYDEPAWIKEMMDYLTDFWIAIYKKTLEYVQIDHIHIWEDMSGKQGPLISPDMFRKFMMPNYKKITRFAKDNNIAVVSVDTDGNMDTLMPLLAESGIHMVLPFEVQAGCDIVEIRRRFPNICLCGGIDKLAIAKGRAAIDKELDRIAPLLTGTGYIPGLDHLPHPDISFADFSYFTEELRLRLHKNWHNVLLTDSGFYHDNELDKPLAPLIDCVQKMLQKPFWETKVLFIPTAAAQDKQKAAEITTRLKNELLAMGMLDENITVHDIDGSLTEADVMTFDMMYLTGGKTPYLAKRVRETGFDKIIKNFIFANKTYVGMSAGSVLLASHFNVDDMYNPTYEGLGLIKAYFSVHCVKPEGSPDQVWDDEFKGLPLPHITLQENQSLQLGWDGYKIIKPTEEYP